MNVNGKLISKSNITNSSNLFHFMNTQKIGGCYFPTSYMKTGQPRTLHLDTTKEVTDYKQQRLISHSPFPNVFTCLQYKSFENTVGKGEIAHNGELSAIFIKFEIVVCKLFQFERV